MKLIEKLWIKYLLVASLSISIDFGVFSQSDLAPHTQLMINSFKTDINNTSLKSSPLLFEKAQLGNISLAGGKSYQGIPFNINLENGEVYIQSTVDVEPFIVRNWEKLETVGENKRIFVSERIGLKQEVAQLLWKGERARIVAVLRKSKAKLEAQRDGYSGPKTDDFLLEVSYFQLEKFNATEIKTTKQGLKAFAGAKEKDVQALIKQDKLKLDKPEDFKKVVLVVVGEQ